MTEDEIRKYMLRLRYNSFGTENGRYVTIPGSYINHSCNPNLHYVDKTAAGEPPLAAFRGCRVAAPGAPATIAYVDTLQPREACRTAIANRYNFTCL